MHASEVLLLSNQFKVGPFGLQTHQLQRFSLFCVYFFFLRNFQRDTNKRRGELTENEKWLARLKGSIFRVRRLLLPRERERATTQKGSKRTVFVCCMAFHANKVVKSSRKHTAKPSLSEWRLHRRCTPNAEITD